MNGILSTTVYMSCVGLIHLYFRPTTFNEASLHFSLVFLNTRDIYHLYCSQNVITVNYMEWCSEVHTCIPQPQMAFLLLLFYYCAYQVTQETIICMR